MNTKSMLNGNTDDPLKQAAGLSAVWQRCMSERYKSDCRSLIPKEHGQLGKLRKSLGMTQAAQVVEYAIRNWEKFAQKAANNVGAGIFPRKPCVSWFYQYHAIAVLMLHDELQTIAQRQAAREGLAKEAQEEAERIAAHIAAYEADRKQKPSTLEELEALEAEVEAEFAAKHKLSA